MEDLYQAQDADNDEPDGHNRAERTPDASGAMPLRHKQDDNDHEGNWVDGGGEAWRDDFKPGDGG